MPGHDVSVTRELQMARQPTKDRLPRTHHFAIQYVLRFRPQVEHSPLANVFHSDLYDICSFVQVPASAHLACLKLSKSDSGGEH